MRKRLLFILATLIIAVVASSVSVVSAQQQGSANTWTVEYFNNSTLTAPAVLTRYETLVSYNWGAGSPVSGVPADNFSARFVSNITFAAGTYRFYLHADDGVRFSVDNVVYLNTFDQTRPDVLLTVDVAITAATHRIQIDYREVTSVAFLYFNWANLANNPTGPNFPAPITNPTPVPPVVIGGPWTGEYFNNNSLTGTATAIISESTPSHNWGNNAPMVNLPADNFSVRWRSTQYYPAGRYQITVSADDGIRVWVDGILHINEWHNASGLNYNSTFDFIAGNHTITVEYYEAGGLAFINYNLSSATVQSPTPAPVNTGPVLTVTTGMLNVRNQPATTGIIITRIPRGSTYPIVGRTDNNSWWQININGTTGWVSGSYVTAINTGSVPVINNGSNGGTGTTTLQPTGFTLITTGNLNMRSGPGTTFLIISRIPQGRTVSIYARTADSSWWLVNYNGVVAWVSGRYVILSTGTNINTIPVRNS